MVDLSAPPTSDRFAPEALSRRSALKEAFDLVDGEQRGLRSMSDLLYVVLELLLLLVVPVADDVVRSEEHVVVAVRDPLDQRRALFWVELLRGRRLRFSALHLPHVWSCGYEQAGGRGKFDRPSTPPSFVFTRALMVKQSRASPCSPALLSNRSRASSTASSSLTPDSHFGISRFVVHSALASRGLPTRRSTRSPGPSDRHPSNVVPSCSRGRVGKFRDRSSTE